MEHAKLEMEAKAQEEKVRKELQLKSAELAATNKALLEATSQNHSDRTDTSPLSPVSFQDGRFEPTDSIKPEGAGMAALRRVRGNITKPSNTQAETSTDGGLKATTAALQKLRAITAAKASGSSSPEAETTEISPKSPPVVLHAAAQRAKVGTRIFGGRRMHPLYFWSVVLLMFCVFIVMFQTGHIEALSSFSFSQAFVFSFWDVKCVNKFCQMRSQTRNKFHLQASNLLLKALKTASNEAG